MNAHHDTSVREASSFIIAPQPLARSEVAMMHALAYPRMKGHMACGYEAIDFAD